jgi:uncharacterized protein YjiK
MRIRFLISLFFACTLVSCFRHSNEIISLKLVRALPVQYLQNEPIEPSGLAIYNSELYTVSDDHDSLIFKLQISEDKVVLEPFVEFKAPPLKNIKKLDLEGITCDPEGNFYLCSESACQILFVSHDGKEAHWIFESLKPYGEEKGLFQVENAYLEGIALSGTNQFILCAEREPRGIIDLHLKDDSAEVRVYNLDKTNREMMKNNFTDFTGLFVEGKTILVLERAASAISRLDYTEDTVVVSPVWSYDQIENSDELRYADTLFRCGEGLALDDEYAYVILDNNGEARYSNPEDKRPLLFIMERPEGD